MKITDIKIIFNELFDSVEQILKQIIDNNNPKLGKQKYEIDNSSLITNVYPLISKGVGINILKYIGIIKIDVPSSK
jgi:hypothetical protein